MIQPIVEPINVFLAFFNELPVSIQNIVFLAIGLFIVMGIFKLFIHIRS